MARNKLGGIILPPFFLRGRLEKFAQFLVTDNLRVITKNLVILNKGRRQMKGKLIWIIARNKLVPATTEIVSVTDKKGFTSLAGSYTFFSDIRTDILMPYLWLPITNLVTNNQIKAFSL